MACSKWRSPPPCPELPSEASGGPVMGFSDKCLPMSETHCLCSLRKGRVGKAGIDIKNNTRGYGTARRKLRWCLVLARDLCICTCIPMIIVKTLSGREYIFLLIRLSVTLNLKGKPHILEEVPTVHRCPHLSLLLKKLSSD